MTAVDAERSRSREDYRLPRRARTVTRRRWPRPAWGGKIFQESDMLRILVPLLLIALLLVSITAILSNTHPARLKAAGWGMLSGGLIIGGVWMIFNP
jgi:hypothetical protein